jgi:diguanylate cyclase (GGDEF)-like protein
MVAATRVEKPQLPEPAAFPRRILIVEDDPTIRLILEHAFTSVPEVIAVGDGEAALEAIARRQPEFIVTDLNLPVMDGHTMIKHARRTFEGACVPILVLTGSHGPSTLLECFREGADDFMVKPFSMQELRIRVSSIYLRQRVARDMNPLSLLPGNLVLKREIARRIESGDRFAVCYLDLDHFKGFNDAYGFDRGDAALLALAQALRAYAATKKRGEVFIGHVGGDDFVALVVPDLVEEFAREVHTGFDLLKQPLFSPDDLAKGTVTVINRKSEREEVPLLSVSIAALFSEAGGLDDMRKIAQVAAEMKKLAKAKPGNSLAIDRRCYRPH